MGLKLENRAESDLDKAGAPEIEITPEMIAAGADSLEEFTGSNGLTNSAAFVAAEVYRAMERRRLFCIGQS